MNEDLMKNLGLEEEVTNVKCGICPCCVDRISLKDFKDEASYKEFGISGLCQDCQDELFTSNEE
jgi:hypothetical protein